jgi:DNA repair protein RecO (recombination protein O)
MQWVDRGFVLAARPFGESAVILELFTAKHGRHLGLVHGGQSPRRRAILQSGNAVEARWRGRLAEHLGTFGCEVLCAHAARFLDDPLRLLALSSVTALLSRALPEREPYPDLFAATEALLFTLDQLAEWPEHYVLWECRLLAALGFGLDLERGAESEASANRVQTSARPKRTPEGHLRAALHLTGQILLREVLAGQGRSLPAARKRLALLLGTGGKIETTAEGEGLAR